MKEYFGSCHCAAVKFRFISDETVEIWKCNCSICHSYDYQHLFIKHEDFELISGRKELSSYKFGTINNPHPPYPLIARKKGWEGKLLLNVKINADGTVKDIKIEQSSGYKILDDISKKTLKKWSFIPARLGKKNTEDNLKIPVRFVLND